MRSCRRLASLATVLCALRFAARLADLLLRLPEFTLEAPQLALKPANLTPELALEPANLTLESFDPIDRRVLRVGCGG
jgi:hypothetical protein